MLKALVAAGADVNARDRDGDSALAIACQNGYEQCVTALLEAGAATGAGAGAPLGASSPMRYAARFGAAGCIRILRKFSAEIAPRSNGSGQAAADAWTPLHDAAEAGYVECVRALLDIGASVNACDTVRGGTREQERRGNEPQLRPPGFCHALGM